MTVWKGISSLLMYMARTGCVASGRMPTLRKVIFAGEALRARYLMDWMRCFRDKEFFNGYGPTEATGLSTIHRIDSAPEALDETIPIGRACANTEVFLLDEELMPVPAGQIGELCIRGSGVSRGYWNDPSRTAESFISNPRTDAGGHYLPNGRLGAPAGG